MGDEVIAVGSCLDRDVDHGWFPRVAPYLPSWRSITVCIAVGLVVQGARLVATRGLDVGVGCLMVLQLVAVAQLGRRRSFIGLPAWSDVVVAAPSVLIGAPVMWLVRANADWTPVPVILCVIGTMIASAGLIGLGESFALFPARRRLVVDGPYRLVRHPIYLGELTLTAGLLFSSLDLHVALAWMVVCVFMVVLRTHQEESLLADQVGWSAYVSRTRYRLLPLVW